jgi:lipopolysaccharide export system protein LptA
VTAEPDAAPEARKKIPSLSLLPPGSELKDVMLPRYDPEHVLTSVLKAKVMTLMNADQIEGKTVSIEFFNPDKTQRGQVDLIKAQFDQAKGLLTAKEPVEIRTVDGNAQGTGIYYDFTHGKGFISGPATTVFRAPPKTSMNTTDSPFRAMALLGMSVLTQSLLAAPPPAITEAQLAAIRADAASRAPAAAAAAVGTRATLDENLAGSAAASQAVAGFLVQADLPPVPPPAAPDQAVPLDLKPGPDDTVVSCDGGIYFDPDEGVLVYLKNVKVKNPQFDMSGRIDELKVFFGKKAPDAKDKEKSDKPEKADKPDKPNKTGDGAAKDAKKDKGGFGGGIGKNIGKPERVVATGAVKIDQKPENGEVPIQASAAIFTYNVQTEEIIMSGGFPWVRQGPTYLRSKLPDNLLRIHPKESRFDTGGSGGWEGASPTEKLNK